MPTRALTPLQAAKHAGIFPATLIKEPEAAALYTLHVLQERALAVSARRSMAAPSFLL